MNLHRMELECYSSTASIIGKVILVLMCIFKIYYPTFYRLVSRNSLHVLEPTHRVEIDSASILAPPKCCDIPGHLKLNNAATVSHGILPWTMEPNDSTKGLSDSPLLVLGIGRSSPSPHSLEAQIRDQAKAGRPGPNRAGSSVRRAHLSSDCSHRNNRIMSIIQRFFLVVRRPSLVRKVTTHEVKMEI